MNVSINNITEDDEYYKTLGRRLGSYYKMDADDSEQEALFACLLHKGKFEEGRATIRTFLTRVVINHFKTINRKEMPDIEYIDLYDMTADEIDALTGHASVESPEVFHEKVQVVESILEEIKKLDVTARELIELRFYNDVPFKDAARELRLSLGAARTKLHRTLKELRRQFS